MKKNLFLKIFFSYLVIITVSFFVLDLLIKDEIKKVLISKVEAELKAYVALVDLQSLSEVSAQLNRISQISNSRVTLIDASGSVLADSEKEVKDLDNHLHRPEVQESRVKGYGRSVRFSNSLNVDMLYIAAPVKRDNKIMGYIRLARPLQDVKDFIEKVYQSIFVTIVILAIISLLTALFISYRLAAPIRLMEKVTRKLRQGQQASAILLHTSDETRKLADNINYLVEELKNQIRLANEEKSKLMTAITSINEGVLILNEEEKIEFISPAINNILNQKYDNIFGKTLMEALRNLELLDLYKKFKETRSAVSGEVTLGDADPVITKVSISPFHGANESEKAMVVFHDITRLRKLEMIRTDFVANVTHEIRTPLTAIIGYLETIKSGKVKNTEDINKFVSIMLNQAQRLNRLVEDLMTISKIELGEMSFKHEDIDLSEVIGGVIPLLERKAQEKKIKIINGMTQRMKTIRGDKDRLMQIFVNILDNAVKFTQENGEVTINASETKGGVIVDITDTGTGIPKEEIQRLGERFYRVDKTRSRDLGGTGLGLSIVKHLMVAHGGRMEIKSALGRGTTVSLFFPYFQG
ncbi:MAG TPA: ATP-binding protein [Smithellaceae bacterium]|nr:ATP-binding protein [Smithellaceae bacterium]HRS89812.1 ATP-binding protein [Smithellaceae bacterium]HRV26677.1 ATP-binding protein [Smithellaceae bacterium]